MILKTENKTYKNPNNSDIQEAINEVELAKSNFAIISFSKYNFIQTAKTKTGFIIEYRLSKNGYISSSRNKNISQNEVVDVFSFFKQKSNQWKNRYEWEKVPRQKSQLSIISNIGLAFLVISIAGFFYIQKTFPDFFERKWDTLVFIISIFMVISSAKDIKNWKKLDNFWKDLYGRKLSVIISITLFIVLFINSMLNIL